MGLPEVLIGLVLLIVIGLLTLMINPPEKWVRKLTGDDSKDK